jgi:glycosyltransferase involved in cell wall biosynthesis
MSRSWPSKLVVLMPVFNDWQAVQQLLPRLDSSLKENRLEADVLLVNDGSTEPPPDTLCDTSYTALQHVEILSLRRNVGNQRAIALGIAHVHSKKSCEALIVMDGDGEDDPRDVPRLIEAMHLHNERCVVFAARMKRSESWIFCLFYHLYRLVHLLLTGVAVRVGNFSIVPAAHLNRLVLLSELWNHYAAAVFKSRIPYTTLPTHRTPRLAGHSRMNFVGLVAHGLSAISVFSETVAVRLLLANGIFFAVVLGAIVVLAGVLALGVGVPGWVYPAVGVLGVVLGQCLMLAALCVMMLLGGRSVTGFLPERDYHYFIDGCETVYQSPQSREELSRVADRADVAGV